MNARIFGPRAGHRPVTGERVPTRTPAPHDPESVRHRARAAVDPSGTARLGL